MNSNKITAIIYALAAALFYAINVPLSKLLLEVVPPTFMTAFMYLGAGFGVGIMYLFHLGKEEKAERLARMDLPYTVWMIVLDIIAPILLMLGVKTGTAANASLLGNFEIVATSLIALFLFREKISLRLWAAIALITFSSIILTFDGSGSLHFSPGSLLVLGAAACWGLENNCTRNLSSKSTYEIVTLKGFFSGGGSLIVALILGEKFTSISYIPLALLLGFVAYGLSIFTYIRAQKTLGAAKTSAYYAAAPFAGVFLSFVLLKERPPISYFAALIIMVLGTVLVVIDTLLLRHSHEHSHTFTYAHNGIIRTHIITHSHSHNHLINENQHYHEHTIKELEKHL